MESVAKGLVNLNRSAELEPRLSYQGLKMLFTAITDCNASIKHNNDKNDDIDENITQKIYTRDKFQMNGQ